MQTWYICGPMAFPPTMADHWINRSDGGRSFTHDLAHAHEVFEWQESELIEKGAREWLTPETSSSQHRPW